MKNFFKKFLKLIDGKKTVILGILSVIVLYLLQVDFISAPLAYALEGILTVLGGGASYATKRFANKENVAKVEVK